jgi:pentatricopeptide repeat protein
MKADDIGPSRIVYTSLINGCGKTSRFDLAAGLLTEMMNLKIPLDEPAYNTVIEMHIQSGSTDNAFRAFNEMTENGFNPNNVTYNILLGAYRNMETPADAFLLFDQMKARGLAPDRITYHQLFEVCRAAALVNEAFALFGEMEANGVPADAHAFTALIDVYRKTGRTAQAQYLFDEMKNRSVPRDAVAFSTVIAACVNGKAMADAVRLVREAISSGVYQPSAGWRRQGLLDFHKSSILTNDSIPGDSDGGVMAEVAIALMAFHAIEGRLSPTTVYIVGQHGTGKLKETVLAELTRRGYRYVASASNPGRLVPDSLYTAN